MRRALLSIYRMLYEGIVRRVIFRGSAQSSHEQALRLMRVLDSRLFGFQLRLLNTLAFRPAPIETGGIKLDHPLVLAAGWVKGDGFDSEDEALIAVHQGRNIIPGWRAMPTLVGPVEFGSFTRWPRVGNSGNVLWRDERTLSTQNRIGLKNPGAQAAAAFLARHHRDLPACFGINIAVSPGVMDVQQERAEVLEAIDAFLHRRIYPSWFTLNLSCPNTEDDPLGNQTEAKALDLCGAVTERLSEAAADCGRAIPLWVKVSPALAPEQYQRLMHAFHQAGVRAIIATNTLGLPAPDNPSVAAGVGGGKLHTLAVEAACLLAEESHRNGYSVDVIGCGGVMDGNSYSDFAQYGIRVVQYLSALIYRGPLAAAVITDEAYDD